MLNNFSQSFRHQTQPKNHYQGLGQFLEQAYYQVKAHRRLLLSNWLKKNKLFVHTMGKVGSSTVIRSLHQSGLNRFYTIYWTHYLSQEGITLMETLANRNYHKWQEVPKGIRNQILLCRFLQKQFQTTSFRKNKLKIITLVREPIARNISSFFQNYELWLPHQNHQTIYRFNRLESLKELTCQELADCFLENYYHDIPLKWFGTELKPIFNIDVFYSEFPQEKGYQIYEGEFADLLLIKLEKFNQCAQKAFQEFLKVENFQLTPANVGGNKDYSTIYKDLESSINLPKSYIKRMYDSQYTQHFYSESEIEKFKNKWLKLAH
ncbi:Protein of unknown function NKWYS [Halothece sp. PCC 7418]|uniref:putative capsular polysaccharide synthesis family protein n=1 Tax=Halothece sp. (strain PCC 7418) TaxID=65093 RepID=UPI0002A07512|nr:putative capsular polysaccharide synthesis family protein [Halothece sp. PCC 7418]AFZ44052.1 Protein of unknown function NKWYS [Halothece sp. PCC 7418]